MEIFGAFGFFTMGLIMIMIIIIVVRLIMGKKDWADPFAIFKDDEDDH